MIHGILSSCLVILIINEAFSYDMTPKSPSVIYNGSLTFAISGFKRNDYLYRVSIYIPKTQQSIKLLVNEGKNKATHFANYWSHYYFQTKINKIILNNVDYHLDGAMLEVFIFSANDRSLVKLITEPIKIDYKLSFISEAKKTWLEKQELRGREIIVVENKITLKIDAPKCFNGRTNCWVGFCGEAEDEKDCKLYEAVRKTSAFNNERFAMVPDNPVRIRKGSIIIDGDPTNLLGSTFVIKSGNEVISSNPITYGEAFRMKSQNNGIVSYEYNGENNIDHYDITLLSNQHKNPHKLCSCSISSKTCNIEASNMILVCTSDSISFRDKSIKGLLMFRVSHTYTSRDLDSLKVKEVSGTAGFIQLN